MILADFLKAVAQLGDRRFLRVFGLSVLLTLALLAGLMVAWGWLVSLIPESGWTVFGYTLGFLDEVAAVLAWTAGALGAVFLMFPVAALFIGLFLEEIADAVERRHYPHLPPAGRMGFWETLGDGAIFFLALILANLLGLVLYLISGPLAPFVFLAVNGWVLGRQFFELAAARRIGARQARRLRREAEPNVWFAGVLLSLGLAIPILNLAIPVLGVAAFTHMYHRVAGDREMMA